MTVHIRQAINGDAEALLQIYKALDSQTQFLLFEPNERAISLDTLREHIHLFSSEPRKLMAVAEVNDIIAGVLVANDGQFKRNQHCVTMFIGIDQPYWRQGIGEKLITFLEQWAHQQAVIRIEFTVMEHNNAARALYRKMGYQEEGLKRSSLKINNTLINEVYMAKVF